MSLDIFFCKDVNPRAISTWHVGTKFHLNFPIAFVDYVQADGDELEHIRHCFPNLPITLGGLCKWHGDFAKFIVANLR